MSKARIIPYVEEHGQTVLDTYKLEGFSSKRVSYSSNLYIPGMSFTCVKDDIILGCAGVIPLWDGVGEAWSLISPIMREHFSLTLHRGVTRFLNDLAARGTMHRLHCHVLEEFEDGHRWAKALGFYNEGVMKAFGPMKENFCRYAKLY